MRRLVFVLTLVVAAPASAQEEPEILEYAVREGETCGMIARRMYGHSRRYDIIHEHNPELGPMPHRLHGGQVLRLPQIEVSDDADATVTAVRRRVDSQRPQAPDWDRARVGQELYQGWRVSTGEQSSAELTFRASSVATIREETLVIVYGGEARRVRREGARAVIREGAMLSRLSALSGQDPEPLEVETPTAVASLSEGEHSVHVERGGRTRVAAHRGRSARVRSRRGHGEVEVPEGHGTSVTETAPPTPPRRLPAAPRWIPDQPSRYLAIRSTGGSLEGAWQPVNTAAQYRVELARREDGRDMLVSTTVPSRVTRFELHRLPPGEYHARVSTIDEEGFEGRPPDAAHFTLVGVDVVEPGREPPRADGDPENPALVGLDGLEDLVFPTEAPPRVPILQGSRLAAPDGVVCAVGDSEPSNALTFDTLGDLYLTCVDPEGQNIVGLEITVAAIRMRVLGADGSEDPTLFRDREGTVLIAVEGRADEATVEGGAGVSVVEATPNEGGFRVRIRTEASAERAVLRLVRGDAELASAAVGTADAPPDEDVAPVRSVHEGLGRAAFPSAVGLVDERRRGHAMWMGMHFQSARIGEPDARLRTTVGLRASLLDERLRIGAQVPLDLVGQGTRLADRGERDVFATVSSLIVSEGAVGLAAEAGLWIPTAGDQSATGLRHARLQVAADFSLRVADRLTLRTRQAGIFDLVADESMLWASAYGVDVWIAGPLSLGVEGTMTMGREEGANWYAGGAALAVGLDLAPVFLSVIGRYGFGDDLLTEATIGANARGSFDL